MLSGQAGRAAAARAPPQAGPAAGLLWRWTQSRARLPPLFFFAFLPCKDNQVYVKYVCSFDSPRYLINSITPNTIVPKVFEMRIGTLLFLILSITVNIFLAVAMAGARVHENTE